MQTGNLIDEVSRLPSVILVAYFVILFLILRSNFFKTPRRKQQYDEAIKVSKGGSGGIRGWTGGGAERRGSKDRVGIKNGGRGSSLRKPLLNLCPLLYLKSCYSTNAKVFQPFMAQKLHTCDIRFQVFKYIVQGNESKLLY